MMPKSFSNPLMKFFASVGPKPVDPLTDLGTVTRWVNELPSGDAVGALDALLGQVREYNGRKLPATREGIAVLGALDEAAQAPLAAVQSQYLQNPRMSRVLESRLWNCVHAWLQEILAAYHAHIMEYIANPVSSRIAGSIPLLTARAVHYFADSAAWAYYRYTMPAPKMWKRLHNLFHFAEYEEFERRPIKLYPDGEDTTIASLYLQALMLDTLNTGGMTPRQMHLVSCWLPMLVADIEIDRDYKTSRHTYYVDLAEDRGARRIRRVEPGEMLRYWGVAGLAEKLENLKRELASGALPARLGLTEACKLPSCMELLEHIAQLWSPAGVKRSRRSAVRQRVMKSIEVLRGFGEICLNVRADNAEAWQAQAQNGVRDVSYEEMVDVHLYGFVTRRTREKLAQGQAGKIERVVAQERWVMENESAGGYGAQVEVHGDDWVRLGKLVGLKPDKKTHWNVGVVRRLRRIDSNQQYVGIEVIAERPVSLVLRPSKDEARPLSIDGLATLDVKLPLAALYVKGGAGQPDTLILPSAEYTKGRELWFNARGFCYQIRLGQVLERGDDWLRARFEVVAKDPL